ncbi:MAG TPA: DNA translocase FtsK 4TM domain-containing protein [bacterium]|nr:DNA translocase FtsK 4TM domain-containing protein [bacterium]
MAKNAVKRKQGSGFKYGREAVGLLLAVLAVVSAASLVTRDAADPVGFGATGQPINNKLGIAGAWLSFWLLETLGFAAFALPFFFGLWAFFQFRGGVSLGREFRLIVFLLAIFFGSALLALTVGGEGEEAFADVVILGGAVGLFLRNAAIFAVGRALGVVVAAVAFVVAAAWAVAGVTPKTLWNGAAAVVKWIVGGAASAFRREEAEGYYEDVAIEDAAPLEGAAAEAPPPPEPEFPPPPEREAAAARPSKMRPRPRGEYMLPSLNLLSPPEPPAEEVSRAYLQDCKKRLEAALSSYKVEGRVREIKVGPRVSRFEVELAPGQKFGAMKSLEEDLARSIAVPGVTITSLASRGAVAVDVPNPVAARVVLRELLATNAFKKESQRSILTVPLGRRHDGAVVTADLTKMPHLLVAGATGSGKSIFLNAVITSLLMTATPEEVQFVIIDPKKVDLSVFADIPHRRYEEVLYKEVDEAVRALRAVVRRMEGRYKLLAAVGARNLDAYNRLFANAEGQRLLAERIPPETDAEQDAPLPYVVVVVDELNDLMVREKARRVEEQLVRLAQMARAVGIHLVVATQRPSVDVITGVIKANFPSRIAFSVMSQVDSRTILDRAGAEHLLPEGDMLFLPTGAHEAERVQGAYVGEDEVRRVVDHWAEYPLPEGLASLKEVVEETEAPDGTYVGGEDELFDDAASLVISQKTASVSMLQRRFRIGFARAGRLIDTMERRGIVGPAEGSKPRKVLVKSLNDAGGLAGGLDDGEFI